MPKKLTEHFTLDELVASQTASRKGIDNTPSPAILKNLLRLATVLEDVRLTLDGAPLIISSGYRSPALNKAVGGSKSSAHMEGLAVDFTAPFFGTVLQTAKRIAASKVQFDQVIHEYGSWVHLGLASIGEAPRLQKLSIFNGTNYIQGLMSAPS